MDFFWFWKNQKGKYEYFGLGYFSTTFEADALAHCGDLLTAALRFPKVKNIKCFLLKFVFKTKTQQITIFVHSRSSF